MKINDIEKMRGCLVRTKENRVIGRVKDLVYSRKDLILRYPVFYLRLSGTKFEVRGTPLDELKDGYPWLILNDESLQFITRPEINDFVFTKETRPYIEILKEMIINEDYERYHYMTHMTPKWRECLKDGVEPRTLNKFLELTTLKRYSMWCGKEIIETGNDCEMDDYGTIVTKRTCGHISLYQYLFKNDMLSERLLFVFHEISNWFISFEVIEPKDFIEIYSKTGEILWER